MVALFVLAAIGAWLFLSAKVTGYVAGKIASPLLSFLVGCLVFSAVLLLPSVDEIIGRRQFRRLCTSEAVVYVSPNASKVLAARSVGKDSERHGFIFPVEEQSIQYVDVATGEIFYSLKAFHTKGGFLMRNGLGLGNSTSCWPENWASKLKDLNIDALLKRGNE